MSELDVSALLEVLAAAKRGDLGARMPRDASGVGQALNEVLELRSRLVGEVQRAREAARRWDRAPARPEAVGADGAWREAIDGAVELAAGQARPSDACARAALDHFFSLSLDLLCVAGVDGFFRRLNPAWSVLGWTPEELTSQPFLELVHPDDRASTLAEVAKLSQGIPTIFFENRYRTKDGRYRWLAWTSAPDESGTLYAVARDVTGQKQTEEAMKELQRSLQDQAVELVRAKERAEKESRFKSSFLAGMSHELRTPLNAIIGFSELLEQQIPGPLTPIQLEYVLNVLQSGRHLLNLINDILDLSKIEAGKMELRRERIAPAAIVDSALGICAPLAQARGVRLEASVAADVPDLYMDPVRLKQIVYNLLSNGIKFTPSGGSVRVEVAAEQEQVRLVVRDTGIGVRPEDMPRLFREFEQIVPASGEKPEGTGLGLALTRRLVGMHGGSVSAESEVGKDSSFTVLLPLPRRAEPSAEPATDGEPVVLVVEDDPKAAELIAGHLRAVGLGVIHAPDAETALRLAAERKPAAITLDILMPGMDGWAVLSRIKTAPATAGIPIVVVSVVDEPNRGLVLGATDYLVKPVSRDRLADTLEAIGLSLHRVSGLRVLLVGAEEDANGVASHLRAAGCEVLRETSLAACSLPGEPPVDLALVDLSSDPVGMARQVDEAAEAARAYSIPILAIVDERRIPPGWRGDLDRLALPDDLRADRLVRAIRQAMDRSRSGAAHWHTPTGLPSAAAFAARLGCMLGRAERDGQRVALIAYRLKLPTDARPAPLLGPLREGLRPSDLVGVAGRNVVALACPAIDPRAAGELAGRFAGLLEASAGTSVLGMAMAWYPADGRRGEALLARVLERLGGSP